MKGESFRDTGNFPTSPFSLILEVLVVQVLPLYARTVHTVFPRLNPGPRIQAGSTWWNFIYNPAFMNHYGMLVQFISFTPTEVSWRTLLSTGHPILPPCLKICRLQTQLVACNSCFTYGFAMHSYKIRELRVWKTKIIRVSRMMKITPV